MNVPVENGRIVVLTGGVGGAKLVRGLMEIVAPERITAIVNTADDFRHLGLWVSPDLDTLLYTVSDKSNRELGWGREGESWAFMDALRSLGGADWFRLGDGDLALHVLRTQAMAQGQSLSRIMRGFTSAWGVGLSMLPMSDDPVATHLTTDVGDLPFQRYFVERQCAPAVSAIRFEGADAARPAAGVLEAITGVDTQAILIAPSNPYLSVDPILAVPGVRAALRDATAPVVAVSPIVGGTAVKGPTAKLMQELGLDVSTATVAAHYADFMDAMLIDQRDAAGDYAGVRHGFADTLMKTLEDKARVATAALALADSLRR